VAETAVTEAIHRPRVPAAMSDGARALETALAVYNRTLAMEATLAMSNCALAMSALSMSNVGMLRRFIRSMGAAHDFAQLETGIVRNLSKTLTRSEPRRDLPEAVASGFGQQVDLFQGAETEPRLRLLPPKRMAGNSGLIRNPRQHTMVAMRRCDILSVRLLGVMLLITALFITAPLIAVLLIAGLFITALLITVLLITGLFITAPLRGVVRSMGFAYDLPEVKTGIVRNFSPALTSFEPRDHLLEAVARGFGQ